MTKSTAERGLEARAGFFKALAHPARLLVLNLLAARPRHTEELAAILGLTPATVSFHLGQLSEAKLVESHRDQYYQVYSLVSGLLEAPVSDLVFVARPELAAAVEEDAYRRKVLDTFLVRGRLRRIPAQRKKRQVVLEALADEFEPDRDFTEREVNRLLVEYHDDVAALRRGLIEFGLMTRSRGKYRRMDAASNRRPAADGT